MASIEGLHAEWYDPQTSVLCFSDGRLYVCVAGEVIHAEVLMLPNGMSKVGLW